MNNYKVDVQSLKNKQQNGNRDIITCKIRKDRKDIWNTFMCLGAEFDSYDIPFCPTTADKLPETIITWKKAKAIYKKMIAQKKRNFYIAAFVCWYMHDYRFDGVNGIWHDYKFVLKVLRHFQGAITPDFSTYQDFPEPLKKYNTYRMRAFGYWLGINGIAVINNVRWGTAETYQYCFAGVPQNSIIAIGTLGGSPRKRVDRKRFNFGLDQLFKVLKPNTIVVYGSSNYPCFRKLERNGVKIVAYPGETSLAFKRGNKHE